MTTLKTMIMAGATLAVLAAPAVSMAQTWDRDHYRYDRDHDGWRDREWRAYDRYEDRRSTGAISAAAGPKTAASTTGTAATNTGPSRCAGSSLTLLPMRERCHPKGDG